jgi:tetraprenyl-beta-curcumene synthase
MTDGTSARRALTICLLTATPRYWLSIYPQIRTEIHYWGKRASEIPDPHLRALALEAHRSKRGNIEGSAAFATFVPPAWRSAVARTQIAFQTIYDYVDTLAEQPNDDPIHNAHQLHQALLAAVAHNIHHGDYYALSPHRADGGYLAELINTCRATLHTLPSHATVARRVHESAQRIVGYQSRNLTEAQGGHHHLRRWAQQLTPPNTHLRWWETAAAAGSSLGLFALIAAAAQPTLTDAEAASVDTAYWPWIGALHSLLDSLTDEQEDQAAQQHSLLAYYHTPDETITRFRDLATEARHAATSLPNPHQHLLILAAMASHYMTTLPTPTPLSRNINRTINEALGPLTRSTTYILTTRRHLSGRLIARARPTLRTPRSKCAPRRRARRERGRWHALRANARNQNTPPYQHALDLLAQELEHGWYERPRP